ncbi:hypothetical protein [Marivita sp.]|uniref:hypothetical protein n=1 Tax=Marivita sp. TaxID=2003365 RepID=UPI0025C014FF|nr:hypothetical protein [Marivita sp.]
MMVVPSTRETQYHVCSADGIRAEFGVCRGEPIRQFQDLVLGDIYLAKPDATWTEAGAQDDNLSGFTIDLAANLPLRGLTNLAHLVFMTTTGRRADAYAAVCDGHLYFVCEHPFQHATEYVLIDINARSDGFVPAVVPTPARQADAPAPRPQVVETLRKIG